MWPSSVKFAVCWEISCFIFSDSLDTRQVPYFSVVWVGLNTKILLQTILLCPHKLTSDTQFLDILSGQGLGTSSLVSETPYTVSEPELGSVMDSVRQCASKRFLLVLDCYQGNDEQTEIVLQRALRVGDVWLLPGYQTVTMETVNRLR